MEQQAPYRAVPNTVDSEKKRSAVVPGKRNSPLRVLLATVGNSDRGQNPVAPLPGLKPHYVSVSSLLEARQKCLEYIDKTGIGGGNWAGGEVREGSKKPIARVSYNGRLWQPGPQDSLVAYPPLVEYREKSGQLQVCYGPSYQNIQVRPANLLEERLRLPDPLEIGKVMSVRFSQDSPDGQLQAHFESQTICRENLFGRMPACPDTTVPVRML